VFPFVKFPGVDTILGPEMKSTGEVMGVGKTFGEAFVKSQLGAGAKLPAFGQGCSSRSSKATSRAPWKWRAGLVALGFDAGRHQGHGSQPSLLPALPCGVVNKVTEGRPHVVDMIKNDEIGHGHQHGGRASQRDRRFAPDPHLGPAGAGDHLHHHRRGRGRPWKA